MEYAIYKSCTSTADRLSIVWGRLMRCIVISFRLEKMHFVLDESRMWKDCLIEILWQRERTSSYI